MAAPGSVTETEISEQPAVLARVLREAPPAVEEAVAQIVTLRPLAVLLAARGTSGNAARYLKYLIEVKLGLPVALVSPSTTTLYGAQPSLSRVLLVAVSQSGGSPDLVEVVRAARSGGALTLAVTNCADSPLAQESDLHVDVLAGPERAVPATKSYTAQLLVLWLLVQAWAGADRQLAAPLPDFAAEILARTPEVDQLAGCYRFADRLVITGRGFAYATAREAALKLMETSFVSAHAWSAADLMHGPLAVVDAHMPCMAIVPAGPGGEAMAPVLQALVARGADLTVVGDVSGGGAARSFTLPQAVAEDLAPVLQILPLQLLAHRVALARGYDPDSPRGLSKVTRTR